MRFEYTPENIERLNNVAVKINDVTSQHTDILHDANLRNYVDIPGINSGLWMYMSYFNLIDQYIQRGRRINHIMDFGCGIGFGWHVWQEFWAAVYPDIKLTNMKRLITSEVRGDLPYENKYDLLLNELGVPHSYYEGNVLMLDQNPIRFPDGYPKPERADCIIASRVCFEPFTRWDDALGHMVSRGGFMLKEREGPQDRAHRWKIIHIPLEYRENFY